MAVDNWHNIKPEWMEDAPCTSTDPEVFYPSATGYAQVVLNRQAVSICLSCPVASQCLDYALENDERWGVWGGTTEKERGKLRRRRAA